MNKCTPNQQIHRRRAVMWMFCILMTGIGVLVFSLVVSTYFLPESEFIRGIVLTAISGAIGSFLSLIGIIVKGVVDNLTKQDDEQTN